MPELQLIYVAIYGREIQGKINEYQFFINPPPNPKEEHGCLCLLTKRTDQPGKYYYEYLIDSQKFKLIHENKELQKFIKEWGVEYYAILYEDSPNKRNNIKKDILTNNPSIKEITF